MLCFNFSPQILSFTFDSGRWSWSPINFVTNIVNGCFQSKSAVFGQLNIYYLWSCECQIVFKCSVLIFRHRFCRLHLIRFGPLKNWTPINFVANIVNGCFQSKSVVFAQLNIAGTAHGHASIVSALTARGARKLRDEFGDLIVVVVGSSSRYF